METLLDGEVTRYLWDEASVYGDVILETDGDGDVLASYVLGGMNLLSQTREGDTSYFSQDALGSTRALTDAAGNLTDAYSYSAFGESYARTGTWSAPNGWPDEFTPRNIRFFSRIGR